MYNKGEFFFFLVCVYGANVIVQSSLSIQLYSLVKSLKMLKILSTSWKKYSALRLYYVTIPSVVNVNINNLKQLDIHKLIMINTIILTMICPTKKRGGGGRDKKNSSFVLRKTLLLLTLDWTMKEVMSSNLRSNVTLLFTLKRLHYHTIADSSTRL